MPHPKTGRSPGRPSTPVERKRATGNPGHRALPDAPMPGEGLAAADADVPPAPATLGDEGLAVWHRIWTAGRTWLAVEVDPLLIRRVCEAWDEGARLREYLDQGGLPARWYETPAGQVVTHPAVTQLRAIDAQVTTWLSMLGFTPSDRARLGLAEVRTKDPLDELAARRGGPRAAASG